MAENRKKYRGTLTPGILCTNRIDIEALNSNPCQTARKQMSMTSEKIEWGRFRVKSNNIVETTQFHRPKSKKQDPSTNTDKNKSGEVNTRKNKAIGLPTTLEEYHNKWKLPNNPKLIIWLVTALDNIKEKYQVQPGVQKLRHLCRDIIEAVAISNSWLIVKSNDTELFNYVGNALDIHNLTGLNSATVIGMMRWPYNKGAYCEVSEETKEDNKEFLEYTIEYNHGNESLAKVNPNIKYHICYDTLTKKEEECEVIPGLSECAIFLGGDNSTLTALEQLCSQTAEVIPVILVKGFGGRIDKLVKLLESSEEKPSTSEPPTSRDNEASTTQVSQSEEIKSTMRNIASKLKNYEILDFTTDTEVSLTKSILNLLIKTRKKRLKKTKQSLRKTDDTSDSSLLNLCIEFNQFNVFKTHNRKLIRNFNLEKTQWLTQVVYYAVKLKRQEFIEHFINNGSNLNNAFSLFSLNKLYTETEWKEEKDKIQDLSEIAPLLGVHLGDYFAFQRYKKANVATGTSKTDEVYSGKSNKNALRDLFVWSVLADEVELSQVFWRNVDHPIIAALFAYGVFRSKGSKAISQRNTYKDAAKLYEDCAIELINLSYDKGEELTFQILLRQMPEWGNTSCIVQAMETSNKAFLSEKACIKLRYKIWENGYRASFHDIPLGPDKKKNSTGKMENYDDEDDQNTCCSAIISRLLSPRSIFFIDLFGFLAFLIFYAYLLVIELQQNSFHWLEWVVWAWIITFFLDGFHKLSHNTRVSVKNRKHSTEKKESFWETIGLYIETFFKIYYEVHKSFFELLEFLAFVFFIVAWSLRCSAYFNTGDATARMEAALVFFSIDYVLFCLISFKFFYLSQFFGPMLLMISKMCVTLMKYLVILLVFFIAFAIASETVLNPHSPISGGLIFNMLRRAYWSAFGNYFLDELESTASNVDNCTHDPDLYSDYTNLRCPSNVGRYYVPVLMGIYVMITNILLFNLIIAKFNTTIVEIEKEVEKVWHYQRFRVTAEYSRRLFMQPPFFLLTFLIYTCLPRKSDTLFSKRFDTATVKRLQRLEQVIMDEYFRKKKSEEKIKNRHNEIREGKECEEENKASKLNRAQSNEDYKSNDTEEEKANDEIPEKPTTETQNLYKQSHQLLSAEAYPGFRGRGSENSKKASVREEEKKLKRNLKIFGRTLIHLPPDGNCIFKAAISSLKEEITPQELRHKVYKHIKENMKYYEEFLENPASVENVKDDGHWDSEAGDLIPYALAKVLGRNLTIVTNTAGSISIPVDADSNEKPIFLAYLNYPRSEHYYATK